MTVNKYVSRNNVSSNSGQWVIANKSVTARPNLGLMVP